MLVERMQHFVVKVVPNSIASMGQSLRVDLDAPFRLFGVVVWNLNVPGSKGVDGQLAIRIARPDGRTIQRQITASNQLFPGNRYNITGLSPNKALASPICPSVVYPAGSVIEFDVLGLNTGIVNPTGVMLVFIGTNIYESAGASSYPPKWTARPYLDNLTVTGVSAASFPILNQPFTAQSDSDFVWQGGAYTDLAFVGGGCGGGGHDDLCQLVDLGIIVRDASFKGYSNDYVPAALLFPFLSAEAPGWLYPEIYIPRLSQIYFDFNYLYPSPTFAATPITLTLGLKGMKVYAQ